MSSEIAVTDQRNASRYEITVDGKRAGFLTYRLGTAEITFLHAEVDPAAEGQGLGSRLVAEALDDARARELSVRPRCPFVADYIEEHLEYGDLVADEDRCRLGI